MSIQSASVRQRVPVTAACLLAVAVLATAGRAQAEPVNVDWGDVFTLNAQLGFQLGCPHTLTITIDDPAIVAAIDPPAETTKQAFKFEALSVGTTMVTLGFDGTKPCPGTATKQFIVSVAPDLSAGLKAMLGQAKSVGKAFSPKFKDAFKDYDDAAEGIFDDFDAGEISRGEAMDELMFAAFDAFYAMLNGGFECLQELESVVGAILGSAGFDELPAELQTGGCKGAMDGVYAGLGKSFEQAAGKLFALLKKDLMELQDESPGLAFAVRRALQVYPYDHPGPDLGPSLTSGWVKPPRLFLGATYTIDEDSPALLVGGVADSTLSQVHLEVDGPGGFFQQQDLDFDPVPERSLSPFQWRVPIVTATAGPSDGVPMDSGMYRVTVRYVGDTNPADAFFISLP